MEVHSIESVIKALNADGIRYLIVGGLAVNAHGYERLTLDVDLVIQLHPENVIKSLQALQRLGYVPRVPITAEQFADAELRTKWRNEKRMFVLPLWSEWHRRTPIDIFVDEPFDFDEEYANALQLPINPGVNALFIGLEGLLRMKVEAGREKDLLDVRELRKLEPYR